DKRDRNEMLGFSGLDQLGDPRRLRPIAEHEDPPLEQPSPQSYREGSAGHHHADKPYEGRLQRKTSDLGKIKQPLVPIGGRKRYKHQHQQKGYSYLTEKDSKVYKGLMTIQANRHHGGDGSHR